MKIDSEILKRIWPNATFINFQINIVFDYINIAGISGKSPETDHHLFFALYDNNPELDGWYDQAFDRRSYFPKITFDKPHWSFVVEEDVDISHFRDNSRIIVIKNLVQASKILLNYVLETVKPKVCAVTGSVGKTTTVGLIEQILSINYKCLRVYTKRISPPILCTYIINKIEPDTQYIVLEMAMWRKKHVEILAKMLKPDIGIILNIKEVHLGIDGINTKEDILESKSKILNGAIPILNIDDPLLQKISNNLNALKFGVMNKTNTRVYVNEMNIEDGSAVIIIDNEEVVFKPFLLTYLTLYQIMAAICAGIISGIETAKIIDKLPKLFPRENRLIKLKYKDYRILFDGERSLDARIEELSNNLYQDSTLLIYRFEDNYPKDLIAQFPRIFNNFNRVHILNEFSNREQLSRLNLPSNTKFITHEELLKDIPTESVIFLHYSVYYRNEELSKKSPLHLFGIL